MIRTIFITHAYQLNICYLSFLYFVLQKRHHDDCIVWVCDTIIQDFLFVLVGDCNLTPLFPIMRYVPLLGIWFLIPSMCPYAIVPHYNHCWY